MIAAYTRRSEKIKKIPKNPFKQKKVIDDILDNIREKNLRIVSNRKRFLKLVGKTKTTTKLETLLSLVEFLFFAILKCPPTSVAI